MNQREKDELVRDGLLMRLREKLRQDWTDSTWEDIAADGTSTYWEINNNTDLPPSEFLPHLIRTVAIAVADNKV